MDKEKQRGMSESGQSFIAAYLIIFLLCNFSVQIFFISYPLRGSQVLTLLLLCIAAPFIYRVLVDFLLESPWWIILFALYLFFHPIIFSALVMFQVYKLPSGFHLYNVFLSNISWFMLVVISIVIYQTFTLTNYHRFFLILYWAIVAMSLESLVSYGIFKLLYCTAESSGGFKGGIISINEDTIARLGILQIPLSIAMAALSSNKYKKMYYLAIPLAMMMVVMTMSRSAYVGLFLTIAGICAYIFIFLPILKGKNSATSRLAIATILIIFSVIFILALVSGYNKKKFSLTTFWSRTVTWARGVEIGVKYFPIGVGGLSARYNGDENIEFTYPQKLILLTDDPFGEQQKKINSLKVTLPGYKSHSLHSLHVSLFANFGIAGLIIIAFFFYVPLRNIFRVFRLANDQRDNPMVLSATFLAITLLSLQPALFMDSTNDLLWIIMACNFYLLKVCKMMQENISSSCKALYADQKLNLASQ